MEIVKLYGAMKDGRISFSLHSFILWFWRRRDICYLLCEYKSHCPLSNISIKHQFPSETGITFYSWLAVQIFHCVLWYVFYMVASHTFSDLGLKIKTILLIINSICMRFWLLLWDVWCCVCVYGVGQEIKPLKQRSEHNSKWQRLTTVICDRIANEETSS